MGGHGRSGLLKVHAQLHIAKIEAIDVHRRGWAARMLALMKTAAQKVTLFFIG